MIRKEDIINIYETKMKSKFNLEQILSGIAGVLLIIAGVAPYFKVNLFGFPLSFTLIDISQIIDLTTQEQGELISVLAVIYIVLGILITGISVSAYRKTLRIILKVIAAISLIALIYSIINMKDFFEETGVEIAIGHIAVIIASILLGIYLIISFIRMFVRSGKKSNYEKALESDLMTTSEGESLDGHFEKSNYEKALESDLMTTSEGESLDGHFEKSNYEKALESDLMTTSEGESLDGHFEKSNYEKALESDLMTTQEGHDMQNEKRYKE